MSFVLKIIVFLLFQCTLALGGPSQYNVLKLPSGSIPIVDGNMNEWSEAYFIDSIRSDLNVACINDTMIPWTPDKIQFKVYAAYNDSNVYFAVRVTADNFIKVCGNFGCDGLYVKPSNGGQFHLWSNNTIQNNPSSSYVVGRTLYARANATGNGNLPTYEFCFARPLFDELMFNGEHRILVGTNDNDRIYLAVGYDNNGAPSVGVCLGYYEWQYLEHYPAWSISATTEGPALNTTIETIKNTHDLGMAINVTPNPVRGSAIIGFPSHLNNASVSILDLNGRVISNYSNVSGNRLKWNATNQTSGIYLVKVKLADKILFTRFCLMK